MNTKTVVRTRNFPHFKTSKVGKIDIDPIYNNLFTVKFDNSKFKVKEKKELENQILYINGSASPNSLGIDFLLPVEIGFNLNVNRKGDVLPYEALLNVSKYDNTTITVDLEDKHKKVFNRIVYSGCKIHVNPLMMYNLSYDNHAHKTLNTHFEYTGCEIFNSVGKSIYKKVTTRNTTTASGSKKNKK